MQPWSEQAWEGLFSCACMGRSMQPWPVHAWEVYVADVCACIGRSEGLDYSGVTDPVWCKG